MKRVVALILAGGQGDRLSVPTDAVGMSSKKIRTPFAVPVTPSVVPMACGTRFCTVTSHFRLILSFVIAPALTVKLVRLTSK